MIVICKIRKNKRNTEFFYIFVAHFFVDFLVYNSLSLLMEDWRNTIPNIELYSDGSADPNPGRGGYGIILRYKGHSKECSCGFTLTTNNRMEIMGVVRGLEMLKTKSNVEVFTDSRYVVNAVKDKWIESWVKKGWKTSTGAPVQNIDLWKRLQELIEIHNVNFNWIKGHVGHPENERCDQLAKMAYAEGSSLCVDEGYVPEKIFPKKVLKEGDPCKKCLTPVIKVVPRVSAKKMKKSYYFEYYLVCPNCRTLYMLEEAKVFPKKREDPNLLF